MVLGKTFRNITFAGCTLLPASAYGQDFAIGKYLCAVLHLAGIQIDNTGTTSSGNFKPADDKFLLTIAPVTALAECSKTKMAELNYWYFCLAKYAVQVDNRLVLRGDRPNTFTGLAGGEYFQLNSDMTFLAFTNNFAGGNYVSDGKCIKM